MSPAEVVPTLAATVARLSHSVEADNTLSALLTLGTVRRDVADLERALVADLRARGYSWGTIGSALGTTRQAAWERFGASAGA